MAPVRLGTIGYGIMGERLLRAALNHDPAILVSSGAWDPGSAAMARLRADLPHVSAHDSVEALIAASDVVHVASPPASHLSYAEQLATAGKAIFCEKPLSTDVAAARTAIERLKAAGARMAVNFPFASSFAVDQLKAWIADGVVGTPTGVAIEVAFPTWPRAWQMEAIAWLDACAEGGFTREVVSHFLFLTERMLGPAKLGKSLVTYPPDGRSERAIEADLMAGAIPIRLAGAVGTTDKPDHNTWTIEGVHGAIRLRDWAIAERRGNDGTWQVDPSALPNETMRPLILKRQLDKVAAMARGAPQDLATFDDALRVQEMVEAILAGDRRGA